MIFPSTVDIDLAKVMTRRYQQMIIDNANENSKRKHYSYKIGDSVYLYNTKIKAKLDSSYRGPFKIVGIHNNGTATLDLRTYFERFNLRLLKPL